MVTVEEEEEVVEEVVQEVSEAEEDPGEGAPEEAPEELREDAAGEVRGVVPEEVSALAHPSSTTPDLPTRTKSKKMSTPKGKKNWKAY